MGNIHTSKNVLNSRARRKQDNKVTGLNPTSLQKRKRRNVVTMRYNMFISLLEFGSLMVFFIWGRNNTSEIIYSLISLGGTPLIYHLGMEDNRNNDIAHAKNSLKIFHKKHAVKSRDEPEEVHQGETKDDVRVMDLD